MKNFMKMLGVVILTVILSVVATIAVIQATGDRFLPKTFDSADVTAQLDVTPATLQSLTDVYQLRQNMMDESRIDSTFLAIPDGPLSNVVSVLLKRNGFTTKDDIVNEYVTGRAVYDNLPPTAPTVQSNATTTESDKIADIQLTKEGNTTVMEGPPTDVGKSQPSKDTVIGNKRYRQVE